MEKIKELRSLKNSLYITVLLIALLGEIGIFGVVKNKYDTDAANYIQQTEANWQQEYDSVMNSYGIAADVIAERLTRDPALISALLISNDKNETNKAHTSLLTAFDSVYKSNLKISLGILQVHNEHGDVLARFQKPEHYGDNLLLFRKSVREVHESHKSAHGYEAGINFNAYRYIFPVIESGRFLGSVELGIKESQINKTLLNDFSIGAYLSLVPAPMISTDKNFIKTDSFVSKELYHNASIYDGDELALLQKIFSVKPKGFDEAIVKRQKFIYVAEVDNENYLVIVKPFFDFSNNFIGYMTFYEKDNALPAMKREFYYFLAMTMAIFMLLIGTTFVLVSMQKAKQQKDEALRTNKIISSQASELEEANVELDTALEEARTINDMLNEQTEKLRIAEERLKLAAKSGGVGIWEWVLESNALIWDDAMFALYGAGREEFSGAYDAWASRVHKDDIESAAKALQDCIAGIRPYDIEFRVVHLDGSIHFIKASGAVMRDENGKPMRMIGTNWEITEQKQANTTLQKVIDNLKRAEKIAKIGNWSLDLVSNKLEWSDEIFRIFEIDKEKFEASYEAFLHAIHPDDRDAVNAAYTNSLATKQKYEIVHRLLMEDGRIKYVKEQCESDFDENGNPLHSIGTVQDITELKHVEEELRESEARLQTIIDMEPECVKMIDSDGRLVYMNPAGLEMIEARLEQVRGKQVLGIITPPYREAFADMCKRTIAGESVHLIFETIGLKGKHCWLETTSVPMQHKGETVLLGVTRDITKRKEIEDKLHESNQLLEGVVEHIPAMVFLKRASDLTFELFNRAGEELLGFSRSDLMGKGNYDFWPKEQAEWFTAADRKVLASNEVTEILEEPIATASGETRYLHTWKVALRDKDGNPAHLLGVSLDITERKKMEEQLKVFNEQLEQKVRTGIEELRLKDHLMAQQAKMAAMGEMIGAIAHQWKQPLNALSLIVQDSQEAFEFGEMNKEYLEKYVADSLALIRYMSKTIDDFRNFFRPDKERVSFKLTNTVQQVLSILGAQLKEHSIQADVVENKPDVEVFGYPNEFKQVVLNIINNAKDAVLENKTESPRIEITIDEQNGHPTLLIADNGGGIPDDVIAHIFEPFFTTKSNEKGTGIGLSMSKTIIEESLQGTITAANKDGGAEFKIVLPTK